MFGAVIDIYRSEISQALACQDDAWIARIAKAFCERCHYARRWKITDIRIAPDRLNGRCPIVNIDIEFDDGRPAVVTVCWDGNKRRLMLNGEDCGCQSSADVVHKLETPCSFFDGIYFAAECLVEAGMRDIQRKIDKWSKDAEHHKHLAHDAWHNYSLASRLTMKAERRIDKLENEIRQAIRRKRLVNRSAVWTIMPLDFESRMSDGNRFIGINHGYLSCIDDAKTVLGGKSGIYFAWDTSDGSCMYVGKSKHMGSRLSKSRPELKDCKITYILMPERHIHHWELFYIWLHKPKNNIESKKASSDEASSLASSA